MVPLTSLVIPIVLSAVIVFLASSVIRQVLTYHRTDMKKVPNEDEFLETLRRLNVPPGDYGAPHASAPSAMRNPQFVEKMARGPIVFMTVAPGRPPSMAGALAMWFTFALVVSTVAGYITSRALPPGAPYLEVFRFAGCTAFVAHALGAIPESIWYHKSWATTFKNLVDGLVYGLLTAGTFGWLWPR